MQSKNRSLWKPRWPQYNTGDAVITKCPSPKPSEVTWPEQYHKSPASYGGSQWNAAFPGSYWGTSWLLPSLAIMNRVLTDIGVQVLGGQKFLTFLDKNQGVQLLNRIFCFVKKSPSCLPKWLPFCIPPGHQWGQALGVVSKMSLPYQRHLGYLPGVL